MALISIIIPAYNHADKIKNAVKSVLTQTFKDFEIVVVDDGSEDDIAGELAGFSDNLRFLRIPHSGAPVARNIGAEKSGGKYLFFMDADAELQPEALEKFYEALEKDKEAAFAYSSFYFGWKKFGNLKWDAQRLQKMNFIHTTSMIRREKFPRFDETLKRFQDWDLWLKITERGGRGIWIPEVLFKLAPRKRGMSRWLPSFAYRLPWLKAVKEYNQAADIIRKKHKL